MEPAISVRGIGKQYRIGAKARVGRTLRETIGDLATAPFRRVGRIGKGTAPEELIWALKDVSFDVQPGEVIGVIGRNGAGKSTLLKILSRITEPTEGRIELRGRLASLLEVGTGFHPELTGRENVYLNGSILGMKKVEIDRKFDEIAAFAEIEKFLDTPVKHYSSGMYVRLAFAVAAHLEPEILLVDEVLAVGDAAFQKKCMGKIDEVAKEGRTVLFVSHNMGSIQSLCQKGVLLENGELIAQGDIGPMIDQYLVKLQENQKGKKLYDLPRRSGLGIKSRITDCAVFDGKGAVVTQLKLGDPFSVGLACAGIESLQDLQFVVGINSRTQDRITTLLSPKKFDLSNGQRVEGKVHLPSLHLNPGHYTLTLGIRQLNVGVDHLEYVCPFEVLDARGEMQLGRELVTFGLIQVVDAEWQCAPAGGQA
jgi:lipopolysaccharide transport system ATP-binding protein